MNGVNAAKGMGSALYALRTTLEEPHDRNVAAALQHAHRPRSKPIRRAHVPHVVMAQASSDLGTNAMALVSVGQLAALVNRGRKSALANSTGKDDEIGFTIERDEHNEHEPAETESLAHDAPQRLGELREQLKAVGPEDLVRYTSLADSAAAHGYGFAVECVSVESLPSSLDETQLRLASHDVMPSLCVQGCIYAGPIVSTKVGNNKVDVIDAKSAEAIMSFEGLRSYLRLFR